MRLVILGSGTAVPHRTRASAAHWVETRGASLLLDLSGPAIHRMAQEQLPWYDLDAVWISHFHLDHVGGLAPFLFSTLHAPETQSRRKPLVIYGGEGLRELVRAFDDAGNYRLFKQPFPVDVVEVGPDAAFEILAGVQATCYSTPHTPESLALRLTETGGASLVYTSDTGYAPGLADFARGADLLVMECSFPRDKPVETHLELADAMRIAGRASPRKVVLTHLYPEWDGIDVSAEARKLWAGETIGATDGLEITV